MPEREEILAAAVGEMRPVLHGLYETAFARGLRAGMGTCATCKHWHRRGTTEWGICQALTDDDDQHGPERFARFVMYSGGEYTMDTAADFGCVLHEPREEETTDERDSG
jgi:hypothetical protein